MPNRRLYLLFWCVATGLIAFIALDYWSAHTASLPRQFERQWNDDVESLEQSQKLPKGWFEVSQVEIHGGTPESRQWLKLVQAPIAAKSKDGQYKLEVLVVVWEEEGQRGVLVQYNLVHLPSQNMVWELGRTFLLAPI